jgi:hypothetical protein
MLPTDERTLIEAWHGPNSTAEIASELNIKGSELDLAFRRLKNEGTAEAFTPASPPERSVKRSASRR